MLMHVIYAKICARKLITFFRTKYKGNFRCQKYDSRWKKKTTLNAKLLKNCFSSFKHCFILTLNAKFLKKTFLSSFKHCFILYSYQRKVKHLFHGFCKNWLVLHLILHTKRLPQKFGTLNLCVCTWIGLYLSLF